jgi:hypothetical protein
MAGLLVITYGRISGDHRGLMPFGFHLAMDTLPSGVLPTFLSGQRGITPAFGYGAPHPSARGTSTLLNNVLLSTHYGPLRFPIPTFRRTSAYALYPRLLAGRRDRVGCLPFHVYPFLHPVLLMPRANTAFM